VVVGVVVVVIVVASVSTPVVGLEDSGGAGERSMGLVGTRQGFVVRMTGKADCWMAASRPTEQEQEQRQGASGQDHGLHPTVRRNGRWPLCLSKNAFRSSPKMVRWTDVAPEEFLTFIFSVDTSGSDAPSTKTPQKMNLDGKRTRGRKERSNS
jgi:hypothetical protein